MKNLIAIMQPTYLPWLGYFDIIDQVGTFVFLDNVQFEKRSWQQRNRIRTAKGLEWLTVPVKTKGKREQLIKDVEIDEFPKKIIKSIELNYHKAPYFKDYFGSLKEMREQQLTGNKLCVLNLFVIGVLLGCLEWPVLSMLKKKRLFASNLKATGHKSDLLINICKELGYKNYLSPAGSEEYLREDLEKFKDNGISVYIHNYRHPEYKQVYAPFIPYASVIDLLFNEGDRSLDIIRSGRGKNLEL